MENRPKIVDSRLAEKPAQSTSQVDTPKWGFMVFQSQKSSGKLTQLDIPQGPKKSTSSSLTKDDIRATRQALNEAQNVSNEVRAIPTKDGLIYIKQTSAYTDAEVQ
jgi:hypothetical protein